jgi:hypothetical protein
MSITAYFRLVMASTGSTVSDRKASLGDVLEEAYLRQARGMHACHEGAQDMEESELGSVFDQD